jgi:hypothetical protein
MTDYKKQGKSNKAKGKRFEDKVREDLESKGWIVSKWQNNVEFDTKLICDGQGTIDGERHGKLVPSKPKWNPFKKQLMYTGTGFPDFIAYRDIYITPLGYQDLAKEFNLTNGGKVYLSKERNGKFLNLMFEIIGIECKSNGYLDKTEKEKCKWLLDNNIFSKILIAKKGDKRGEIIYKEFENEKEI